MAADTTAPQGPAPSNPQPAVANPRQVLSTRLAKLPLEAIAKAIGKDDTEACKVRSGERKCSVVEFCNLIDLSGLKLVDKSKHCVDRETFDFMRRITARAMADEQSAQKLVWEDD